MNILERAEITGFWDTRHISLKLHKDVNFFIGVNGSGKTTVINIIAAALSADFETMIRLPFSSVTLYLAEVGGRKKPSIEVAKQVSDRSPYPKITYSIKDKASDSATIYELDAYEEEMLFRRGVVGRHGATLGSRAMGGGLAAKLADLVNVSWLSIHRASSVLARAKRDESFESSVDQKLEELSISLAKYFSVLSSRVAEEIAEFQRNMIVSLLTEQTESAVFNSINNLNLDEEKRALSDIFSKLNIRSAAKTKLDKHYADVQGARESLKTGGVPLAKLMLLVSAYRSHKVVQDWNDLLKKQEEIMSPRVSFLKVLNSLYQNKKVDINQRNELEATTSSGKKMSIRMLSSGEKQLVIILGEALLQQSSAWIYIADEPELSLHVKWQEKLIDSLRLLNPEAQIISATHSPDVVSHYGDRVFDMEDYIA